MRGINCCIVALLLLSSCSPPPPLLRDDFPSVTASLTDALDRMSAVTAFGDVRLAVGGDLYRGSVEVRRSGIGAFSAEFYAAFGITVGSVRMEKGRGTVCIDNGTYTFSGAQIMDTLPVAWGRDLTVEDLAHALLGEVPPVCAALLRRRPDSCVDAKKTISARWKTDSMDIEASLTKRSRKTERLIIVFKRRTPYSFLTFGSFSGGRAYKIELRENDGNYFSIRHRKLKYE